MQASTEEAIFNKVYTAQQQQKTQNKRESNDHNLSKLGFTRSANKLLISHTRSLILT
jgi:hypothetical protein